MTNTELYIFLLNMFMEDCPVDGHKCSGAEGYCTQCNDIHNYLVTNFGKD